MKNQHPTIDTLTAAKLAAQAHDNRRLMESNARVAAESARQRAEAEARANTISPCEDELLFLRVAKAMKDADPNLDNESCAKTYGLATTFANGYAAGRGREAHKAQRAAFEASRPKRRFIRNTLLNQDDVLAIALESWAGGKVGDEMLLVPRPLGWLTPTEADGMRAALATQKTPPIVVLFEGDARWDLRAILRVVGMERQPAAWLGGVEDARLLARWGIEIDSEVGGLVDVDARGLTNVSAECWGICSQRAQLHEAITFWREHLPPPEPREVVHAPVPRPRRPRIHAHEIAAIGKLAAEVEKQTADDAAPEGSS